MACVYGVGFVLGMMLLYKIICHLFPDPDAPKLTDTEILETLGFRWKSIRTLAEELEKNYPKRKVSIGALYVVVPRLRDEGYAESRTVPREGSPEIVEMHPTITEFRRIGTRLPRDNKIANSLPEGITNQA